MITFLAIVALFAWLWRLQNEVGRLRHALDARPTMPLIMPQQPERPRPDVRTASVPEPVIADMPPAPPPPPPPATDEARSEEPSFFAEQSLRSVFEDLFGAKLAIWAGGITLAVAGFFLVRWSIEIGLLPPLIRVLAGIGFAVTLIAAAERARSWSPTAADPRVAQALAGAGIASAYVSVLAAVRLYGLIGPGAAFFDLAGVTVAALLLALRFGAPSAVLGLVGGLAAPALVGGESGNPAILALYLMFVVGGMSGIARRQGWLWLAGAAVVGGFGWAALLIADGLDAGGTASVGALLILLALAAPIVASDGEGSRVLRLGSAAAGAIGVAALVAQGGFGALEWSLYALLAGGAVLLARIDVRQWALPPIALAVALATIAIWSHPDATMLTAVVAGLTLILAVPAAIDAPHPERGLVASIQAAVAFLAAPIALWTKAPDLFGDGGWTLMSLGYGAAAAVAAYRCRTTNPIGFATLSIAAALLGASAEGFALPGLVLVTALAASALALSRLDDRRSAPAAMLTFGVLASLGALAAVIGWGVTETEALWGDHVSVAALPTPAHAVFDLLIPAALLLALQWRDARIARVAHIVAAVAMFVGGHILWRHGFAAIGMSGGVAERVLFTALLIGLGLIALRRESLRTIGTGLLALALLRTFWFELLVCNPFLDHHSIGAIPLINWLAPAYLLPLVAIHALRGALPERSEKARRALTPTAIVLVLMFVFASVRQLFHGGVLAGGGTDAGETLLYSIAAIGTAIGFIGYGARYEDRTWRTAGLALITLALFKVFLVDAADLEGLMRILSFVALGLSLIGVGWLHNRLTARSMAS